MSSFVRVVDSIATNKTVDSGWVVAITVVGSMLLSNTAISPFVFGILGVATIVQLNAIFGTTSSSNQSNIVLA